MRFGNALNGVSSIEQLFLSETQTFTMLTRETAVPRNPHAAPSKKKKKSRSAGQGHFKELDPRLAPLQRTIQSLALSTKLPNSFEVNPGELIPNRNNAYPRWTLPNVPAVQAGRGGGKGEKERKRVSKQRNTCRNTRESWERTSQPQIRHHHPHVYYSGLPSQLIFILSSSL